MTGSKLKLGVNIDHVATLRQARGTAYPSVEDAAKICAGAGADGLTIHLREDRRHIQDQDVRDLVALNALPVNLELAAVQEIVDIALDVRPAEACIVPERREELTTEGGLDVIGGRKRLSPIVSSLLRVGIEVSLFIEPDEEQIKASADIGAKVIELHTGTYCEREGHGELMRLVHAAEMAHEMGLVVNAGHGISMHNISRILGVPHLHALNIGHSIVCRALFAGLEGAVTEMIDAMSNYPVVAKA